MPKPEPKFEDRTKVYDPQYKESYEFKFSSDWTVQDRLILDKDK